VNYILFYPDEMRAESLGCYGHPLVQTPNIDRLAQEGTLFENNYSQHPVCVASRCALVTGWYPHVMGYRTLRYFVDETKPNFIRQLRRAGYATCLAHKNHVFTDEAMKESFDEEVSVPWFGGARMDAEPGCDLYDMIFDASPDEAEPQQADSIAVAGGIDFMRRQVAAGKPFFLFQSLIMPHPPYTIIRKFYDMYDPADVDIRSLSWLEGKPEFYKLIRHYRKMEMREEELLRRMNAIYLGMNSYIDMLLGRVVDALKELGVYDDTTIILCADHGDWAGDAGLVEKWPSAMDDMLTRVPLIIRRPGCPGGQRVKELTQSIDIFPTIFDCENLQIPWDQFGISLKPQLEGAPGDPDRIVWCEGGYDTREPQCFEGGAWSAMFMKPGAIYYPKMIQQQEIPESVCRTVMLREKRYKLNIRTNGEHELYDMLEDPQEYRNLYSDPACAGIISELREKMLLWMINTSDVVPWENHVSL